MFDADLLELAIDVLLLDLSDEVSVFDTDLLELAIDVLLLDSSEEVSLFDTDLLEELDSEVLDVIINDDLSEPLW